MLLARSRNGHARKGGLTSYFYAWVEADARLDITEVAAFGPRLGAGRSDGAKAARLRAGGSPARPSLRLS